MDISNSQNKSAGDADLRSSIGGTKKQRLPAKHHPSTVEGGAI